MRPAIRLFQAAATAARSAATKSTSRLIPFHPTGITGVITHPHPRPTLLNIYNSTLRDLQKLPEESAYRTATETIINHRKNIVEAQIPAGWEIYLQDLQKRGMDSPPKYDDAIEQITITGRDVQAVWGDWEGATPDEMEFSELIKYRNAQVNEMSKAEWEKAHERTAPDFEGAAEPDISAEQVQTIEQEIGGGLIEEIIIQAYEEYKLVDIMAKSKAWEPLMEVPVDGQWTYFERTKN